MKLSLLICSLFLLSLTACNEVIRTKNGQIPAEYMEEARKYTGSFTGMFNGERTHMKLSLDGNKPKLEINLNSNNLLVNNCKTKKRDKSQPRMVIGDLEYLIVDKDEDTPVVEMQFDLKHNCKNVQGKQVMLVPSEDRNAYNIYITESTWLRTFCDFGDYKVRPGSAANFVDVNSIDIPRIPSSERASLPSRDYPRIPDTNFPEDSFETCYSYIKGNVRR